MPTPYMRGIKAREANKKLKENPYKFQTKDHSDWQYGWLFKNGEINKGDK